LSHPTKSTLDECPSCGSLDLKCRYNGYEWCEACGWDAFDEVQVAEISADEEPELEENDE
jgi:primosomal protein N'